MKVMRDDNDGRIVEVQGDAPAPDGFTILDIISRAAVVKMLRDRADDEEWSDHAAIVRDCAKWIEEMP